MSAVKHAFEPEEMMAYLDGELPDSRAVIVRAHLAQCAACQDVVGGFREVSDGLSHWSVEQPPRIGPPIGSPVRKTARSFFARTRPVVLRPAAAAAAVVVVGAIWMGSTLRRDLPMRSVNRSVGVSAADRAASVRVGGRAQAPDNTVDKPEALSRLQALEARGQERPGSARIIRTVSLAIVAKDIDAVRPAIDHILQTVSGFVGNIQMSGTRNDLRGLRASLRVPSARLDEAIASLKALGQVTDETQDGEEVTGRLVDIEARLSNGRNTEKRLTEVLKNRTGKVSDVLEVEREIARVRGEIEQLDAQRKNLEQRVAYATVALVVSEERQAQLDAGTLPLRRQLRNALVDGLQGAYESAVATLLVLLRATPVLMLWAVILWWPVWKAVWVLRARMAKS